MPDWLSNPEPLPDPEGCDQKEVMAFMGLAMLYAQSLEDNLVWLASLVKLPEASLGAASAELQSNTMGQLLHAVRTRVPVPDTLDRELKDALEARNELVHGFFIRHGDNYRTEDGRTTMIRELSETAETLKSTNETVAEIVLTLSDILREMAGPQSAG